MFKFCWHKWEVVSMEVLPRVIEQLAMTGTKSLKGNNSMGDKDCIVQYRCTKCGAEKVKRI